ncbi:MAG: M15 family metallopeptidase [Nitrospiraceae bacterium]|nr:M15 family metallopeptidase [Nitrospiraceae bacterium]
MSRDINSLVPVVRERLLQLEAGAKQLGIEFITVYTLRTEAEQHALFAQGRKTVDEVNRLRKEAGLAPITEGQNRIVTRLLTSVHMFGCAFDVAILKDGKIDWQDTYSFERLGAVGESLGLRWGGRFTFRDWGHFEYTGGLTIEELKEGKRPAA